VAVAVLSTGYLLVGYIVTQLAAPHYASAVVVVLICLGACVLLPWIRFTAAGRRLFAGSRSTDWAGTVAVAMFLVAAGTAGFAALSTVLDRLGIGTVGGGDVHGHDRVAAAYAYYVWHLSDAIPLLKVPETLNWKLSHPYTDHVNGALALVYTVLVAVPLIYAATQIIAAWTSDDEPGPVAERNDSAAVS
jgi:hypothetical protein